MLIRYSDGRMEPARLLGASHNTMRVSFSRVRTPVEFTRPDGHWLSDTGVPVEIDFIALTTEREWDQFCERLAGMDDLPPWDAESLLAGCVPVTCGRDQAATAHGLLRRKQGAIKPFAIQLYERFARGETIEQLAAKLHIPVERVAMRIRAAESCLRQHDRKTA